MAQRDINKNLQDPTKKELTPINLKDYINNFVAEKAPTSKLANPNVDIATGQPLSQKTTDTPSVTTKFDPYKDIPAQPEFVPIQEVLNDNGLGIMDLPGYYKNYADYLGHPYMKMYDDIVPKSSLVTPEFKDLDYYADNFGLDTSVSNLKKKFDALTKKEYEQKDAEYRRSEDAYYQNMAAQGAQQLAAIRDATSQALVSGASRGMQFANQFAAQNAIAEQNSTGALDLATQRDDLKAQEAEAYTQNDINAEDTIRQQNLNVLGQAVANYANEVQRYAADTQLESQNNLSRVQNYQFNMQQFMEQYLAEQGFTVDDIKSLRDVVTQGYGDLVDSNSSMYTALINYLSDIYNIDTNSAASGTRGGGGGGGYNGSNYNGNNTGGATTEDVAQALIYGNPAERVFAETNLRNSGFSDDDMHKIRQYYRDTYIVPGQAQQAQEMNPNDSNVDANNYTPNVGQSAPSDAQRKKGFVAQKTVNGVVFVKDKAGHWCQW